ncbi:SixA phosphatase family protein [Scrofimicrobium sp. R131]|uniref:Histidine phosphatase family protein n=1 Tax=Scrofimicrobium appendicitidis TaxID=3079930 RepID=A0AAU7VA13_9ACTO
MNTAILIRHAHAQDLAAGGDRFRPLSNRGRRQAENLGRDLAPRLAQPALALVSPAVRAQETFELLSEAAGVSIPSRTVEAIYGYEVDGILEVIRLCGEGSLVLVVGHEPLISDAAWQLAGPDGGAPVSVPTATALVFESELPWDQWQIGAARFRETYQG